MFEFLVLLTLDAREISVQTRHIVSIAEAKDVDEPGHHYTDKVRCVVTTVGGGHIAVAEECNSIEARLQVIFEKRAEQRLKEIRK